MSVRGASERVVPGLSRRAFIRSSLSALAAPALMGCGLPSGPDSVGDPRLTARPGAPSVEPTPGLSRLDLGSGRDGILYVPESYSPDTPTPLFVSLHGAGGSAANWESYHERAEAREMILLVPDSRRSTWDAIQSPFGPDVRFLDQALRHTFDRCRIDPAHIALAGFSDGASYALSLGVSNGDLFSNLIAYSPGLFRPSDPIVGRPVVYVSHGARDNILSASVTRGRIVPTLRDADYDVTYEEFDGGHTVPAEISESALDWFLIP